MGTVLQSFPPSLQAKKPAGCRRPVSECHTCRGMIGCRWAEVQHITRRLAETRPSLVPVLPFSGVARNLAPGDKLLKLRYFPHIYSSHIHAQGYMYSPLHLHHCVSASFTGLMYFIVSRLEALVQGSHDWFQSG